MRNPILLLHGLPVTSTIWRELTPTLGEFGTVLAPDLLGLGDAPHPDIAYGPDDYVRWLDGTVLAGVEEPVTLVLHDFGGAVGLNWAIRHPKRVARLVLMNTTVYPDATPFSALARIPGVVPMLFRLMLSRPLFGWQMRAMFRLTDERLIAEYRDIYARPLDRRTVVRATREWTPEAVGAIGRELHKLKCPVLLVWGMADRYIFPWTPHGERFRRDFPGARIAQIAGAAHFLQAEQPGAVLDHVVEFLRDTNQ